ncbi:hypothetical protein EKD16_21145 [Streptomonospora litoralis]|uniref:Uncharacterized protein n=1 Tax=Streptomonospora litoralis TaxID=2498135 RepID=A0A4P6Q9Z9_9ACTN|nr:hypothetical protein EKD16_21145 [Streptomonospora litoralis]
MAQRAGMLAGLVLACPVTLARHTGAIRRGRPEGAAD